ncbi:MAG: hypothetical protein N2259_01510 [Patescibacteria group bacterium]|nr:hypothetical protein [Patescibacteria group bacterium]
MKKIIPLIIILVFVVLGLFFWQTSKVEKQKNYVLSEEEIEKLNHFEPTEKPKNSEYAFRVSSAPGVYPKFLGGIFSKRPREVKGGEKIWAKIKIEDPAGLAEVKFKIIARPDFEKEMFMSYDEKESVWQAEIVLPKEIEEIVWTNFLVKNKEGREDKLELDWAPQNTCPLWIGNLTLTQSCSLITDSQSPERGLVIGTETGRLVIGSATVNLSGWVNPLNLQEKKPAYLIFATKGTNKGVDLTGTGKIVFGPYTTNPSILIGWNRPDSINGMPAKICVRDSDSDKYLGNFEIAGRYPLDTDCLQLGTGYREADTLNYPNYTGPIQRGDCDDSNASVIPNSCHPSIARQKCDPNLSGNWVTSCGDGIRNCGEVCEGNDPTPPFGICSYPGTQTCVSGFCRAGTPCTVSNCSSGHCACENRCCPYSDYYYCTGTGRCCNCDPNNPSECPIPHCVDLSTEVCSSPTCPSGYQCCGGVCCSSTISCDQPPCLTGGTFWGTCRSSVSYLPDFQIAGAYSHPRCDSCKVGDSRSCIFYRAVQKTCSMCDWQLDCGPGTPE